MLRILELDIVDNSEDFAVLKQWRAKGWRITHVHGDTYRARGAIALPDYAQVAA